MEYITGSSITANLALAIALFVVCKLKRTPIQNIIYLGLKNGSVTTDVVPAAISFDPQAFILKAENIYELLIKKYEEFKAREKQQDPKIQAYCIMDAGGLDAILDMESRTVTANTLARLIVNGDESSVRNFLETLASSTCTSANA